MMKVKLGQVGDASVSWSTPMASVAGEDAVNHGDHDGDQTGNDPVSPTAARKNSS